MFVIGELPVGHPQPPLLEVPFANSLSSLGSFLHLPMETGGARDYVVATALLNVMGTYDDVNILCWSTFHIEIQSQRPLSRDVECLV